MIFQHTMDKVLNGTKTQTRRIWKPEYCLDDTDVAMGGELRLLGNNGRLIYETGRTYAAQPGRGKPAVARIKILWMHRDDVRTIADSNLIAEGFPSRDAFLSLWEQMHGDNYDALVIYFCLVEEQL